MEWRRTRARKHSRSPRQDDAASRVSSQAPVEERLVMLVASAVSAAVSPRREKYLPSNIVRYGHGARKAKSG